MHSRRTSPRVSFSSFLRRLRWLRLAVPVAFFALPAAGGILSFLEVFRDGWRGVDGLAAAAAVTVSPDGRHVYVAGMDDDAVAVFARDAALASLAFLEVERNGAGGVVGLGGASGVAVSPDGRHLYATGQVDDSLVVFARDPSRDDLAFAAVEEDGLGGVFGLDGASSVTVSGDGRQVFATGLSLGTLAYFDRDATVDDLVFAGAFADQVGGVDGLAGASSVAVTPDGRAVLVTGFSDDALAIFARQPASGFLTYLAMLRDGVGGVDGLDGASGVAVAPGPEGVHVYVAAALDRSLAVFERDPPTNALSPLAVYRDGVGGVEGLGGAAGVAVSADGGTVAVASAFDGAVAVFARDSATGLLTFDRAHGGLLVEGMAGAAAVAFSPDNRQAYVAASDSDALAAFALAIFRDGFEGGDSSRWALTVTP